MKKFILVAGLSLACCAPLLAQTPELEFSAGGDSAWLPLTLQSDGSWGVTSGTEVTLGNGITFTLNSIQVNSDPYVFYSYNVTNNGSSTTQYTASIPVTSANLAPGSYTVSSSLGISLTNASAPPPNTSTVWISPVTPGGAIQQGLVGGTDAGVDLGTALVSNSTFGSTSTTSYAGGPQNFNLGSPATDVSINETFDLSAGASVGLSGFFDVESVASAPEPSSFALGLLAAVGFGVLVRRCGKARA